MFLGCITKLKFYRSELYYIDNCDRSSRSRRLHQHTWKPTAGRTHITDRLKLFFTRNHQCGVNTVRSNHPSSHSHLIIVCFYSFQWHLWSRQNHKSPSWWTLGVLGVVQWSLRIISGRWGSTLIITILVFCNNYLVPATLILVKLWFNTLHCRCFVFNSGF